MNYTFDFSVILENIDVLLVEAWLTLKISLLEIAFMLEDALATFTFNCSLPTL